MPTKNTIDFQIIVNESFLSLKNKVPSVEIYENYRSGAKEGFLFLQQRAATAVKKQCNERL